MSGRILLLGASGFIGSEIAQALATDGHQITGLTRDPAAALRAQAGISWRQCDLRSMTRSEDWHALLDGSTVIINASGTLQTGLRDDVVRVQEAAILALIEAAKTAGARQFVQISAAGAELQSASPFMATKARADAALAQSGILHAILRPGLVIGRNAFGGTELIRATAGLPLVHLVVSGTGSIQCVGMADLIDAVHKVVASPAKWRGTHDLVARDGLPLEQIVEHHRRWLGHREPRFRLSLPVGLLRPVSLLADGLGWLGWRSPLRSNAVAALISGVAGDADATARLLAREPLDLERALGQLGPAGKADRWHSRLALAYPLGLASLVLLWLGSGILGLTRTATASALLVEDGMAQGLADLLVLGGSLADLAIGLGLCWRPLLGKALLGGLVLAGAYLASSLAYGADLWLDPLAPLLKVLPVMALTLFCLAMKDER